jgi:hypothetical protein
MQLRQQVQQKKHIELNKKTIGILVLLILVVAGVISIVVTRFSRKVDPNQAFVSVQGTTTVNAGQKTTLPIIIDTKGQNINAAEVYLNFNPRLMRVDEITKDGTFFKIWIKDDPKFSNEKGEISFSGGLPNPGFTGKGQVGTITVTLLQKQDAQLVFTPKTRVLLNDGKGTAIPLTIDPITIKVK